MYSSKETQTSKNLKFGTSILNKTLTLCVNYMFDHLQLKHENLSLQARLRQVYYV